MFSYFLLLFLSHFFHFPLLSIFSHEVFLPEHEKFTTCRISRSKRNRKTNENSRKCSFRTTNVCIRNVSKASGMRTPTEELKQHRDSQLSSCLTTKHTPTHTYIHSFTLTTRHIAITPVVSLLIRLCMRYATTLFARYSLFGDAR